MLLVALFLLFRFTVSFSALTDYVETMGRTQLTEYGTIQSDWPNTGVHFQFKAKDSSAVVQVSFANCSNSCHFFVTVESNCNRVGKFEVDSNNLILRQSLQTTPGQVYDIKVRKITETLCGDSYGVLEFQKIDIEGGELQSVQSFQPICAKKHQLLIFGDSFTAGYGVDQLSPCTFTSDTEDVTHAHAELLAESLQSEIHVIAWSGKGVVRNYGDASQLSATPLPYYYNRTLAAFDTPDTKTNYWNPQNYQPQLVMVMLGTNDYSTEPRPSDDQFTTGLVNFINLIRSDYPLAQVLVLCAPGSPDVQCKNIGRAAAETAVSYFEIPSEVWEGGVGCDGHPYYATQQNMAAAVQPVVEQLLAR